MKIRTEFVYPPIPDRSFDWAAYDEETYDGAEDSGSRHHIGHGRTEIEAVADLIEILKDDGVLCVGASCHGSYEDGCFWCDACKAKHPKDCITETSHNLTHHGI